MHFANIISYAALCVGTPDANSLLEELTEELGSHWEAIRDEAAVQLGPESFCFRYDRLFVDSQATLHTFSLIISEEFASMGVLRIVFIEERV